MAKTNEHDSCQQFVLNHLTKIKLQLDQCHTEVMLQSASCPSTFSATLETIDRSLNEFVQLQQQHLSTKLSSQLKRYEAILRENELFRNWSLDHRLVEHVRFKLESRCLYSVFSSRKMPLINSFIYERHNCKSSKNFFNWKHASRVNVYLTIFRHWKISLHLIFIHLS